MLKYWRIWLVIIMVFGSVLAIGLKAYPYGRNGVEIVYVSDQSPAKSVLEQGMFISKVNGLTIKNKEQWGSLVRNLTGEVKLTANGKEYIFHVNKTLGIEVMDIERTNLEFGLDIRGGTRIILKPKEENVTKEDISQVIATLQTRANLYGLKEMNFFPIKGIDGKYYIQIEAAGLKSDVIDNLLSRQGNFLARVSKPVELSNGKGEFVLGESKYPVSVIENATSIKLGNLTLKENQSFVLEGINFKYVNKTQNKLLFLADVYTGKDIELVYTDPQHSGVRREGKGYLFYFTVLVSEKGAENFAKVTSGIPSKLDIYTGEKYLDSKIYLYLDNQLVSDLRIASSLGGRVYKTPQIQGGRQTEEDAVEEKLRLQSIMRSGALPITLEKVSVDVISPRLGNRFLSSSLYAGLLAGIAVIVVVFIRYRKLKISIPMIFISFSEVVIILGIAAAHDSLIWGIVLILNFILISAAWWKKHETDIYAWVGAILIPLLGLMSWTIDLPAIGGIIAAIGTGIDDQIIIADETVEKRKEKVLLTLKQKIKRAFFIIFGSAATTIAAMFPLMSIGVGLVRGFAITTIVGVLVGILVTRPAYARIIEIITEK